MATTDEELDQLDRDIRQFKIEFEQYFGGGRNRPPSDTEWRIEALMKRYGDRGAGMNSSQRFRYSNLSQTYAKYRHILRKRMKQREEAIEERHFGAAARAIESERARRASSAARPDAETQFPFAISCKDPEHEMKKVEQLLAAFRLAKEQAGESTDRLTLEAFLQFVLQKTGQLQKQKNANEVEYIVTVEGRRARLIARVKS
jgi:hypothetical protein